MPERTLPPNDEMYRALVRRDATYEGLFIVGVHTTGIFCRPTCPARKPAYENVEFFGTASEALFAGYRPCKRCRPMEPAGEAPGWLRGLLEAVEADPGRTRDATVVRLTRVPTPLGPMVIGAMSEGLCLLEFADRRMLETQLKRVQRALGAVIVPGETAVARRAAEEVTAYFDGSLRSFSVPLQTSGTPFQEAVWAELRTIPYGETRSYGEQARRIGRPSAVRAVARANGDNRISVVIPCHRVIGADGTLTGYGGGLWRKRWLLELEQGQ